MHTNMSRRWMCRWKSIAADVIGLSLLVFAHTGCVGSVGTTSSPFKPISGVELQKLVNDSEKDRVGTWLYLGTDENYNYFNRRFKTCHFLSSPPCCFEVRRGDISIPEPFAPSPNPLDINAKGRVVFDTLGRWPSATGRWAKVFAPGG
jgi:hypothetical protein